MKRRKSLRALLAGMLAVAMLLCVVAVACAPSDDGSLTEGPETGVYYNDQGETEYTVNLFGGNRFTLFIEGTTKYGNYSLGGEALSLVVSEEELYSAQLVNDAIVLDYNSAEIRFLKKIDYRVEFNTGGGSAVAGKTVTNGKTLAKPQDPVREGYAFLGWYSDAEFQTPFQFDGERITGDTTLYARWGERPVGVAEYTVKFDWNGASFEAPAPAQTVGGKLYALPQVPAREGYRFDGWWVSMSNKAEELSFEFTEDYGFGENTTLFALWQSTASASKLSSPLVNVSEDLISWNGQTGVIEYRVEVKNAATGAVILQTVTGATTLNTVNFASLPAGDYRVSVTAVASDSSNTSEPAVRYYKNKALKRVSLAEFVEPAMFVFRGVENAAEYELNVVCGNEHHVHSAFNNGTSTNFNLSNCDMRAGGITITVTAKASGYASSVSETFVYNRELKPVDSLKYDEATQTVVWNAVEKATNYFVSVNGGNFVDVGGATSFSLKEIDAPQDGKIEVKVYPATKGYNSPAASTVSCVKSGLSAPKNLRLSDGSTLAWDEVTGATSYEVKVGERTKTVNGTSVNLAEQFALAEGEVYEICVKAKGAGESLWSSVYKVNYLTMSGALTYRDGALSWTPVLGADAMEVRVNDGEFVPLETYASSAAVTLTKGGYNSLAVRFVKNGVASRALEAQVYAYTITFNSQLGTAVPTQYKAMGDTVELADANRANYDFMGWYNIPGGAAGNGALFDGTFTATGDVTLYAYYLPKSFTLTYSFGRHGSGTELTAQVRYRENYTLQVPVTSRATQMFDGWFTGENGTGARLTDANGVSVNVWTSPANATVYAHWIDDVLRFELTKLSGTREDVYRVSQGSNIQEEVTIPATYNGLPVAMIGGDAFQSTRARVINIPDTVRIISGTAFTTSDYLREVNIYHVEGNNAIRYWSDEGVLYDYGALDDQPEDTTWLTSTLQFYPRGKQTDNYEIPDRVTTIAAGAFERNKGTRAVTVSTGVTYVSSQAFSGCEDLEIIDFKAPAKGEPVQELTISNSAFFQCGNLTTVNLPARLKSVSVKNYVVDKRASGSPATYTVSKMVGDGATTSFYMCYSLEAINVAEGGSYYSSQDGVLYNALGTELLLFPESKTPVYSEDSDGTASQVSGKFKIPSGVTKIGNGAFLGAKNLKEVIISNTVLEVGECAFYGASYIEKTLFEGGSIGNAMKVGRYAFRGCEYMEELVFGAGCNVGSLGEGAFMGCESLNKLSLPASMREIGDQAFRGCESLAEIVFAESGHELSFGDFVFSGCVSLKKVSLPKNATSVPSFGGIALEEVIIAEGNPYLKDVDGVVFDSNETVLYFYPQGRSGASYKIPSTVTRIAPSAFQNAENLTSITIGANVAEIGEAAFANCTSLETITFADGNDPLKIGKNAFFGCAAETLTVPARVNSVGAYAFANMSALAEFTLNARLTEIPEGMLRGTAVTSFTVKDYVTSIGAYALAGYDARELFPDAYRPTPEQEAAAKGKLETLVFEGTSQLTYIGVGAFAYTKLTAFALPDTVKTIDEMAFYDADGLASFTVNAESALQTIGVYALAGTAVGEIFIPGNVERIYPRAFYGSALGKITFAQDGEKDLYIGEYVPYVTSDGYSSDYYGEVFARTPLVTVNFPARLKELGGSSFYQCASLISVTFAPAGQESRLMYIAEELFSGCEKLESVTIPKSVGDRAPVGNQLRYAIGENAFQDCASLTEVITEAGNENNFTVYANAFGERYDDTIPGITEFTFPRGLVSVGTDAFARCPNIQKFHVDGDLQDGNANTLYGSFDGVLYTPDFVEVVLVPSAREGKVTLHDNAQAINSSAFDDCTLVTEITIPANMKEFDAGVLSDCTMLEKVSVKGEGLYKEIDGILYNGDGTELIYCPVTLFDGAEKDSITFPETLKKISDNAFYNVAGLKEVSFANVTQDFEIGAYAFYGCTGLTQVNLPQSLTKMGEGVFENCSNLQTLTFADGCKLTELPNFAFVNCSSLTQIRIPAQVASIPALTSKTVKTWDDYWNRWEEETLNAGIFHGCTKLTSITFEEGSVCQTVGRLGFETDAKFYYSGGLSTSPDGNNAITTIELPDTVSTIGEYAFYDCVNLQTLKLPSSLVEIKEGLFFLCEKLTAVTLPAGLSAIGVQAFYRCKALTEMQIPQGVTEIGREAFYDCSSLQSVKIPQSVNTLGESLFYNCVNLSSVDMSGLNTTSLPDYMFRNCKALESVTVPEGVQSLGTGCFQGAGLTSFRLPDSVKDVSGYLFDGCASLISVTLHESVTSIGSAAFQDTKITSIAIPHSVQSLGSAAFYRCTQLSSVTLSQSLTVLERNTFAGCSALTNIDLSGLVSLTGIGAGCFMNSGLTSFALPAGVKEIPQNMLAGCGNLETVTLHGEVTAIGGGAFANTGLTSFTLPAKVTAVPDKMLMGCGNLTTLTLHQEVTSLGLAAFAGTGLRSFTLPAKVTVIPDGEYDKYDSSQAKNGLLSDCPNLASVTLHDNLISIGTYAFRNCPKLTTAELTLGAGVETISDEAFANCTGLTSFKIPASVTSFIPNALAGCSLSLSVQEGNKNYFFENGVMYNADKSQILFFVGTVETFEWTAGTSVSRGAFNGVTLNKVTVKSGAAVSNYAFEYAVIKELVVEEDATLGSNAFQYAKLGTVTLGANVAIGSYSFQYTELLPESTAMTISIGNNITIATYAFYRSKVTSLLLGENVTITASEAFYYCNSVTEIFVPKSLKIQGGYPFDGWRDNQTINIEATEEEVAELVKSGAWLSNWKSYCKATIKYGQTKPASL